MVKHYSREPKVPAKACRTRGSDLRVHFKNTHEATQALKGMSLQRAKAYIQNVIDQKEIVPVRKFTGGIGRHAQVKGLGSSQGIWPEKSARILKDLLQNLESNAEVKGLDVENLIIQHVQVNRAQKGRRRTFRAHGRINPYLSQNCHIEIIAIEKEEQVQKTLKV